MLGLCKLLNSEIEASEDKKTVVDITESIEKLFCSNIVHIVLGEDISDTILEIEDHDFVHRLSFIDN